MEIVKKYWLMVSIFGFGKRPVIEQHIAVFGETGSGKTVLLNTFYGWHREPDFIEKNGYSLLASDTSQDLALLNGYYKMKESVLPEPTVIRSESFTFNINVRGLEKSAGSLTWHDYPGEWWGTKKEGPEGERKIKAFQLLLKSDVALIICDGELLKKEGTGYLRRLFSSFCGELERQKTNLMDKQKKLSQFPRTWIICLSKADLLPDKDAQWFREQVIGSVQGQLRQIIDLLKTILPESEHELISLGQNFLLLSSAKFDFTTHKILDPKQHIGIDLIPPISIVTPIEEALKSTRLKASRGSIFQRLTEVFRYLTSNWMKYIPIVGSVFELMDDGVKSIANQLKDLENNARRKGDSVLAVVAAFRAKLSDKNTKKIYLSK